MNGHLRRLALCPGALLLALPLPGQCAPQWSTGQAAIGPTSTGSILASAWWDPDGAGPRSPVLVVGGSMSIPSVGARYLASFDPGTGGWEAFPEQPNASVRALAVLPNGDLVIAGGFSAIGQQPLNCIAVWNRTSWSAPGGGITPAGSAPAGVNALQVMPNGDLVAGGSFAAAGGMPMPGLARWNGSQWSGLGAFTGDVKCLAHRPNGNLIAGGAFHAIGMAGNANLAEWDGAAWIHYGSGVGGPYDHVDAVAMLTNGDVVASGQFNVAGGVPVPRLARWDGTVWSAVGTGFDGLPLALLPLANGQLLAATVNAISSVALSGVALWDGSQWSSYAPFIGGVTTMTRMPNGDLLVGGALATTAGEVVRGLATWDGASWHAVAHGFDNTVQGLVPLPNGDLFAFGPFTLTEGGTAAASLARCRGTTWWAVNSPGSPMFLSGIPSGATVDAQGNLWLAGNFSQASTSLSVVRWSGSSWQSVGTQFNNPSCITISGGQAIVGCAAYPGYGEAISRWNGAQWLRYGAGLDGPVRTVLVRRNGDLIAGGEFLNSGSTGVSRIARWDGTAWQALGTGVDGPVRALCELPNGDLIAAGDFITDGLSPLNLVARWDGVAWRPLGAGLAGVPGVSVRALLVLPDGDLLAGGDFHHAGGNPVRGIARWNGSNWSAVDGSVDGAVLALAQLPDGEVVAAGNFAHAGVRHAAHLARLRAPCPATAAVYGAGCAGAAGVLALQPVSLPWIGSTWRAVCYGAPANSIGADLFGFTQSQVALTTLHPAAGAGCSLLASPDAVTLRLPAAGAFSTSVSLPNAPVLIGVQMNQQLVVGELTAALALTRVTSSNGLVLRLGAF